MSRLLLIDGHSILNRAFYGLPDLTNSAGLHTGAVYGFLNILFRILEEERPDYLTVAFDVHAPTFRHEAYPAYKGTRHPMPEELREQVPLLKKVLAAMNICTCEKAGLEADDILGTLAKKAQADGKEVTLVSGDRDLLQIADEHIRIRIPKTKGGQTVTENYYPADVKSAYSVTPEEFIQVKALQGDASDNIPGVPKVGPKTAAQLIVTYHSVDGVYANLDKITKKALHDHLAANEDQARLSLFLVTIRTDADVEPDWEHAAIRDAEGRPVFYTPEAYQLFTELGFKNYLSRFDAAAAKAEVSAKEIHPAGVVTDRTAAQEVFRRAIGSGTWIGVMPLYDRSGLSGPDRLCALAISAGEQAWYLEDDGTEFLRKQLGALRRSGARIAVFHLKEQYPFWDIAPEEFRDGIQPGGLFDVLLAAYLLNPLKSDYEPEDVASEYLGETLESRKTFLGKKTFAERREESPQETAAFAVRTARSLAAEAPLLEEKLRSTGMLRLYREVELPLSYILYDMQRLGVRVKPEGLKTYGDQLVGRLGELEAAIYEAAGHSFNIASPKQLGHVLFEEMQLPSGKKTKSGYSTAADVLEKLAPDYPIAADVLEYRALTKLKSTYADGLQEYIAADSRIHTTFHQTITATGRISSTDPNLQNIPMRTELGRAIRKVFIPADGWCFTDADYSQIELRILASMSGDEALIEAYRENRDIHRTTAAKVFHTPYEEVSDLQRRNAKAVNFGIVYGISSFGLSQNLSISRAEAQEYIESYFAMFPGVKRFLDKEVDDAKQNGYSVTYFGRRRPVPELKSSNYMQRQFGERVAMNAPIQGTGADIMKIAMIRVWESLHRQGLRSQLILQIHDELLIETAPGEEEQVAAILKDGMMGAARLRVPLEIDCHTGTDWYEAK